MGNTLEWEGETLEWDPRMGGGPLEWGEVQPQRLGLGLGFGTDSSR